MGRKKLSACRKRSAKQMNEVMKKRRCVSTNEILNLDANENLRKTHTEMQNVGVTFPIVQTVCESPKSSQTVEAHEDQSSKTYTELQNVCGTFPLVETLCETPESSQTVEVHPDQRTSVEITAEVTEESLGMTIEVQNASVSSKKCIIDGRRIVSLEFFLDKLTKISTHNPAFGCTLQNLILISEKKTGLTSQLKFRCNMCNMIFFLDTDEPKSLDINKAAISGMITTGIGLSQFEELFTSMDLPCINQKHFDKLHDNVCEEWHKTAMNLMKAAGKRERDAAIERGDITKDGIPYIDVIADGCWSKRSYKANYSALSGAAAIVGRTFGEVLYIGIKNKYCCICARAETKGENVREHACFKNYSGSSTSMESDILLEGFKQSVETHNLLYARMVADGDSSTFKKISEARVYPNFSVEKIECRNHIFRNMCNKLKAISTDTKFPLQFRKKITTERILAIRKVINCAIKKHKIDNIDHTNKINNLYGDIMNSMNHAFGDHESCKDYYCQSSRASEDLTLTLKTCSIWFRIKTIVTAVAAKSRSLINDADSNRVECFNSIVAKFVGGKRVNFSLKRAYKARCEAAVVAFNTKKPLYNLQKSMLGRSPSTKVKSLETRRANRCKKINNKKKSKRRLFPKSNLDRHYGENCQRPDMPEDVLEKCKEQFLSGLVRTSEEKAIVQRNTILQRDSSEWLELRRSLITASNFARIIKRKENTSAKNLVKDILYKKELSHVSSVQHGIANEKIAIEQLAKQIGQKISPCGLFIDNVIHFLGATPDGLIGDDTIVEIKCPISAYRTSLEEAIATKKVMFWKKSGAVLTVNQNHPWYIQVQGQLHVTGRNKCIFAVWSGIHQDLKVEEILRDDIFWDMKMKEKLISFYKNKLLPELCDPRHTRNMIIRD
ncbi:uncharacterized protein LOC126056452 [Helicoverpa armigera]|uniref:uncharacterized protein LOC126056452 n=1 Tax=Helicoverpa armigera TaxID=29058 RepID=UPI003083008B